MFKLPIEVCFKVTRGDQNGVLLWDTQYITIPMVERKEKQISYLYCTDFKTILK